MLPWPSRIMSQFTTYFDPNSHRDVIRKIVGEKYVHSEETAAGIKTMYVWFRPPYDVKCGDQSSKLAM